MVWVYRVAVALGPAQWLPDAVVSHDGQGRKRESKSIRQRRFEGEVGGREQRAEMMSWLVVVVVRSG